MQIKFLGGAGEVGASCILIETQDRHGRPVGLLLDCGIRPGAEGGKRLPALAGLSEAYPLNGIFITHAHLDHSGALPYLLKLYPDISIYCTRPTRDIMDVLLTDSARLMTQDANSSPLYTEADVRYTMDRVRVIEFNTQLKIAPGIYIRMMQAGHILGASVILVEIHGTRILYTGDYSTQSMKTVGPQMFTRFVTSPDILITECTYGDSINPLSKTEIDRLADALRQTTEARGKALIPAFSVGRSQELLLMLQKCRLNVPVYVDGMIQTINLIHEANPDFLHPSLRIRYAGVSMFSTGTFFQVSSKQQRSIILESTEPCIILSSGGMLSGGTSSLYAGHILPDAKSMIALVGHQDSCTPGGRLLDMAVSEAGSTGRDIPDSTVDIGGSNYPVRCRVEKFNFSAHADRNGILSVVETLHPSTIFLVHGEAYILHKLATQIKSNESDVLIPYAGGCFQISEQNYKQSAFRPKAALLP